MSYRSPVRSGAFVRRPTTGITAVPISSLQGAVDQAHMANLIADLDRIKREHEETIKNLINQKGAQMDAAIERVSALHAAMQDTHTKIYEYVRGLKPEKGPPGKDAAPPIAGVDYPIPKNGKDADETKIFARLRAELHAMIPDEPDLDAIANKVLRRITVPKGEKGEDADVQAIIDEVGKRLIEGKILKPEHIAGLPQMLEDVRRRAGDSMRGGGDHVVAGTGISISKNALGRKVITVTSAGLSVLAATGAIDDSNVTFTFTALPALICINGAFYQTTGGAITWTYLAGTVTLSQAVGKKGSIFGLG